MKTNVRLTKRESIFMLMAAFVKNLADMMRLCKSDSQHVNHRYVPDELVIRITKIYYTVPSLLKDETEEKLYPYQSGYETKVLVSCVLNVVSRSDRIKQKP